MSKRPSTTASLPPPKWQERPSSHLNPHLDEATVERIIESIRKQISVEDVEKEGLPDALFSSVASAFSSVKEANNKGLVLTKYLEANIDRDPHFCELLKRVLDDSASQADIEAVVFHSVFWSKPSLKPREAVFETERLSKDVPFITQEQAIQQSWTATFVGVLPLLGLQDHIAEQLSDPQAYGNYCTIVQSSGMGKSRLLDELSKSFFLIPINLRSADSRGYPPSDFPVRDFLKANGALLKADEANMRIRCFLMTLFDKTKEILQTSMGPSKTERISKFREFMSRDQTMNSPGSDRLSFFIAVTHQADELMKKEIIPTDKELRSAFGALREALNADSDESKHRIKAKQSEAFIDAFIMFDEAHTLADSYDDNRESRFVALRRILHALSQIPLYSFFLSTAGKVTQFGQPRGDDKSSRINGGYLVSPRPYVFVGFDQLAHKFRQGHRLEDVTSLRFISHLGRPLWGSRYDYGTEQIRNSLLDFAVEKLLCGVMITGEDLTKSQIYAVLSQRLALDINTTQYPATSQGPLELMHTLHEQVANHMRVCVAVGSGIETLYAVASSEPILSEAASYIMRKSPSFSMAKALTYVLSGFCINQGDCGELLVAALFTCARDEVVRHKAFHSSDQICHSFSVVELFQELFSNSTSAEWAGAKPSICHSKHNQLPFKKAFETAYMHFNHFIKPQEQRVLDRRYLLLYLARGAAALGANCQPGFDAIYPFIYGDTELVRNRVGFVIVQVKNDSNPHRPILDVFPGMDPFMCRLISDTDLEDGRFPIPIIRLLFLLAHPTASIERKGYDLPSHGASSIHLGADGLPRFTSYDFVCRGISPAVFRPVDGSSDIWNALINKSQWTSLYAGPYPDVVRAQLPGCGLNEGHWAPWVEDI